MIYHRKAEERGKVNLGWLQGSHTFSFGHYYDPKHMGFKNLRVINDDNIAGGRGFDTHPHKDMEIITFVTDGVLEHKDTLGSHALIRPGEIQIMSAGSGIFHSEYNHLKDESTKLFQIWIEPNKLGVAPRYEQYDYMPRKVRNGLTLLVSPQGGENIASIYADAKLSLGHYEGGKEIHLDLDSQKSYWLQMVSGSAVFNEAKLGRGDGLAIQEEDGLFLSVEAESEFLLFELS
ncbi:MAG: quercetin 2,3-dioxygenase [Halobacteriovoraceae bacterium]|nr:quercetin 2,3-dioxygenase [Halobacteriovoraceae bacterium]|tara:strand:+ start:36777 stop:37475 length:699 start_codon:yes stop_codon:yes gene_type:complete